MKIIFFLCFLVIFEARAGAGAGARAGAFKRGFCDTRTNGWHCDGSTSKYCVNGNKQQEQYCPSGCFAGVCQNSGTVPNDFCDFKTNGWHCYKPIGSGNLDVLVYCSNHIKTQQQTCQYGCSGSSCNNAPFCSTTVLPSVAQLPYCASIVNYPIDALLSTSIHDNNAFTKSDNLETIGLFANVTFTGLCKTYIKQYACYSEFPKCSEKSSGYPTCKSSCANANSCMEQELATNNASIVAIDCNVMCTAIGSAGFLAAPTILLCVALAMVAMFV